MLIAATTPDPYEVMLSKDVDPVMRRAAWRIYEIEQWTEAVLHRGLRSDSLDRYERNYLNGSVYVEVLRELHRRERVNLTDFTPS